MLPFPPPYTPLPTISAAEAEKLSAKASHYGQGLIPLILTREMGTDLRHELLRAWEGGLALTLSDQCAEETRPYPNAERVAVTETPAEREARLARAIPIREEIASIDARR